MNRFWKITTSYLLTITLLLSTITTSFAVQEQIGTTDMSQLIDLQQMSDIQYTQTEGAKQIIEKAISDIKELAEPDPDRKPCYGDRIEFAVFALQQALDGNFETDNSVKNAVVFERTYKAMRKLEFYEKHPFASADYKDKVTEIIKSVIKADRMIVESILNTVEEEKSIYTKSTQYELKKARKDYEKGIEFENKRNKEQAIHFYQKAWTRLYEIKKEGLQIKDKDNDGCPDFLEEKFNLNKNKADSDKDGLTDGFEVLKLMNLCDGLSDDTDKDGVPDTDEDPDEDGLTNIQEQEYETDPLIPDTDEDDLDDRFEIYEFKTSPLKFDSDEDGLSDGSEYRLGTDPNNADSDGDGIIDSLEEYNQTFEYNNTGAKVEISAEGDISKQVYLSELPEDSVVRSVYGLVSEPVDISVNTAFTSAKVFLPIDEEKVPDGDIQNVKMFYFDEERMTMIPLDNQGIDLEKGIVWGETNHFTTFVLFYIPNWNSLWEKPLNKGERTVETETTFMDIAFVLDSSGSMTSSDGSGYRRIAAKSFVDALLEGDRAAVIDFDSTASLTQELIQDFNKVKTAIDGIDSYGGTDIGAGVRIANEELIKKGSEDRIKVQIVLTDGQGSYDNSLTEQAKNNGIVIYTIGLGTGVNSSLLTSIAQETGGMYFPVSSAEQLPNVFSRISEIVTDPVDTDGDGLPDSVETGGMRDGLGNMHYSDPNSDDTDGDGLTDKQEVRTLMACASGEYYLTLSSPSIADSDNDGLTDSEEVEYGTKPYSSDSDLDKLNDGWEMFAGYDPLNRNPDGDSFDDKQEYEKQLDPFTYDKVWYDYVKDILAGATCGDFGQKLVAWGLMKEITFKSMGYLVGQIASGFLLFGDIRDALGSLVNMDFVGVFVSILGFVPLLGDAAKVSDTIISFVKRGPECIKIAARFIIKKLDDWKQIKTAVLDSVITFLCKNSDNTVRILKRAGASSELIAELAKHNDALKIANIIQNAGKSVVIKTSKIVDNSAIKKSVDNYISKLTKKYHPNYLAGVKAERFAVESAKDYFAKKGYKVLYDAPNGVNGPDLILKNGDDILIVECKGAMSTTRTPILRGSSLNTKTLGPQLSHGWLSTDTRRYMKHVRNQMSAEDLLEFEKIILQGTKKYKAAVVYASENPLIQFAGKMDDYIQDIVSDSMVDGFELLKLF